MRILQATSWISRQGGGVPPVVKGLACAQSISGNEVHIIGLDDKYAKEDVSKWHVPIHLSSVNGPSMFGLSRDLNAFFSHSKGKFDIVHYHTLWMWPGYAARKFAQRNELPLIISPHGMMEPWAMNRSRWKKRIAAMLFEDANLRNATCFHALCESEYRDIRALGWENPIAVIPNGIELSDYINPIAPEVFYKRVPQALNRRTVLFLSRIHPKKGLPHLIKAWASLCLEYKDWVLVIVGPDQEGHTADMKKLAEKMKIDNHVCFTGPMYGEEKFAAMTNTDIFVLPSFSEGFSMAVLEAAACRMPLLLTSQCNFPEIIQAGGGIEIEPTEASTAKGLRKLMSLNDDERMAIGQKAREFVETKYTWSTIAHDMVNVYKWAVGLIAKPDFVRVD